ncbi:MAG: CRISPR-associated primase-polymerase type A1 [Candidatus Desulfofervidaceae bacterium]|nr:CRISPR-associated primase-polymerase type A1 [Candidatus Desulfofervidaceae bacterium]
MKNAVFECLELVKQALAQGHEGKAVDLALRYFRKDLDNPEFYYFWGQTFELLGMAKKAIESYGLALKLAPDTPRYLKPLAFLFYETGLLEQAFHTFKRLMTLSPEDEEVKQCWVALLEELGLRGASEKIRAVKKEISCLRYFPPSLGRKEVEVFLRLFAGKEKGFAEQVIDERTGLSQLVFYDLPLAHDIVRAHILGERTLFFYPMRGDNQVKVAIMVFFISKREKFVYARQPAFLMLKCERLKAYSLKVQRIVNETFGLPAYLERVNAFVYRLWVFLEDFVHFLQAKRFIKEVIQNLPYPEFGAVVEPLMPTRPLGIGWRERPVFLPLGFNRETKERSLFLDKDGEPYLEQIRFLKKIQELSLEEMKAFFSLSPKKATIRVLDKKLEKLRQNCPVVNVLVEKALAGRILNYQEKLVLFYTVGLLDRKGKLLHQVLYNLPDYHYQKVRRILKAMKKNPISCVKIRELVPELTTSLDCHCIFDLEDGRYPSPLLHVNQYLVPSEEERFSLKRSSFKQLAKIFVDLYQQRQRLEERMDKLERELKGVFLKKGLRELEVKEKRLCLEGEHLVVRK